MNKLTLRMPYQLFIGGMFVDAEGAKTYETINPTDGSVSASLSPPPTLSPSYLPHGLFSHLLPPPWHLGILAHRGQSLDAKGLQSFSSPPYRNGPEGRNGRESGGL